MKKWIAYAAYRCEVAGFATDTIDIQCRYFEFADERDIEPALQKMPPHTFKNEAGETVAWIYVKCLIVWDFDRMPKHGEEFGGVHVNAHEIKKLCIPLEKQAPEDYQQLDRHQKLSEEDIRICHQALNEVCHGAYALPEWEFGTLMGAKKSEAQELMRKLDYIGHNAYQNRQLTYEHVFVLHHEHHMADDRDDAKLLGIYATHEAAQQQIDTLYKHQPGFNQADGEFSIDCYEIGKNNWIEGFITETYNIKPKYNNMLTKYRAYKSESESCIMVTVAGKEDELRQQKMFAKDNVLLWEIDAHTYEEMMAIHNLRCGFGPYNPMGEPENCPKCSAYFYPQGSSDCWRCGKIC